jgi:Na+/H+ antiporter NhaC
MEKKKSLAALLPIGIFLVLFLGVGCLSGDFYSMPAVVAFLIALAVAFLQTRDLRFEEKIAVVAKGVGDENIITMCLIFLAAGAFSGAVGAAGGIESTVNFSLSVLPPQVAVVGLMLIGCFISLSMGTSMGTIGTLAPIAVGISQTAGFPLAVCIGAVVSGAMFGDNLSMISDTTIAAVRTQGCEMKDKFRENFKIVLPAAIAALLIYWFLTRGGEVKLDEIGTYHLLQVMPYLVVLIGALIGINVFAVLISGTVLSVIVGLFTGTMTFQTIFQSIGNGVTGMYDITVISLIVACIVALVKRNGGIAYILDLIHRKIKGQKGGEAGIAILSVLVDMATANNTIAIVMAGPIAKEISEEYGISARRSASLLDIFASATQGLIPYGAQILLAAGAAGISPVEIIPYTFYPMIMAVSAVLFIAFSGKKK